MVYGCSCEIKRAKSSTTKNDIGEMEKGDARERGDVSLMGL